MCVRQVAAVRLPVGPLPRRSVATEPYGGVAREEEEELPSAAEVALLEKSAPTARRGTRR